MIDGRTALALDPDTFRLAAAREAIDRLGLLTKEAEGIIWHMLDLRLTNHPRARTTAYRQDGEQLSDDEKRNMGIRSNAFLSRRAFAEITEKGMTSPLAAHETTLLRASFSLFRYRAVREAPAVDGHTVQFKYDVLNMACPVCRALEGRATKPDDAHIFAPDSCECETANYTLRQFINWFENVD